MKHIMTSIALSLLGSPAALAELSEERAEALVHETIAEFEGEIAAIHHLPVDIQFHWANGIFQALGGRVATVVQFEFFGGLLAGAMDEDAFAVVLCHEIGHVLGGAPETRPYPFPMNSVEGQADYFATSKCLRRVFARADNFAVIRDQDVPESIRRPCEETHDASDAEVCIRSLLSARKVFRLIYDDEDLGFDEVDSQAVPATLMGYPSAQCRLDTLKAGALCTRPSSEMFSFLDAYAGACREGGGPDEHAEVRPRCWYRE